MRNLTDDFNRKAKTKREAIYDLWLLILLLHVLSELLRQARRDLMAACDGMQPPRAP